MESITPSSRCNGSILYIHPDSVFPYGILSLFSNFVFFSYNFQMDFMHIKVDVEGLEIQRLFTH
jgi:hypothetical protein